MPFWTQTTWCCLKPTNSEVLLRSVLCSQKTHCLSFTQMNHLMLFRNEMAFNSSDRGTLINILCGQAAARGPRAVSERVHGPWVKINADHNVINIWQKPNWTLDSGDVFLCLPWTRTKPAWHFLWHFCSTLYFTPCHVNRALRAHPVWEHILYESTHCMRAQL